MVFRLSIWNIKCCYQRYSPISNDWSVLFRYRLWLPFFAVMVGIEYSWMDWLWMTLKVYLMGWNSICWMGALFLWIADYWLHPYNTVSNIQLARIYENFSFWIKISKISHANSKGIKLIAIAIILADGSFYVCSISICSSKPMLQFNLVLYSNWFYVGESVSHK